MGAGSAAAWLGAACPCHLHRLHARLPASQPGACAGAPPEEPTCRHSAAGGGRAIGWRLPLSVAALRAGARRVRVGVAPQRRAAGTGGQRAGVTCVCSYVHGEGILGGEWGLQWLRCAQAPAACACVRAQVARQRGQLKHAGEPPCAPPLPLPSPTQTQQVPANNVCITPQHNPAQPRPTCKRCAPLCAGGCGSCCRRPPPQPPILNVALAAGRDDVRDLAHDAALQLRQAGGACARQKRRCQGMWCDGALRA